VVKLRQCDFDKLERGNQKTIAPTEYKPVDNRRKSLDKKLLAYLWMVGPDTYSDSLISKHFGIYHERVKYHKDWIHNFAAQYVKLKNRKMFSGSLHPKYYK
jgi:hypothetical protein